jgi:hypothetical protein
MTENIFQSAKQHGFRIKHKTTGQVVRYHKKQKAWLNDANHQVFPPESEHWEKYIKPIQFLDRKTADQNFDGKKIDYVIPYPDSTVVKFYGEADRVQLPNLLTERVCQKGLVYKSLRELDVW